MKGLGETYGILASVFPRRTDTQTGAGKHTDRGRKAHRQTDGQLEGKSDIRQAYRQTCTLTDRHTDRHAH